MPLYLFYTMVQKSQNDQKLKSRGPALTWFLFSILLSTCCSFSRFVWVCAALLGAAARSQQLLFVVLAAGHWCLTAGCYVKTPLFPELHLKQKCTPRWEIA